MKLINVMPVFLLLLPTTIAAAAADGNSLQRASYSKCNPERDREMDACAIRMGFLGDHSFRVPKNSSGMEQFCSNLKSSITCLQAYSKDCLQGFTRQILTSLLKRGKQQYSSICSTQESRRNFMTKMGCLTDDKIEQFHTCMDASLTRFDYISSPKVKHDNKLPSLCCSHQIFDRDLEATLKAICPKQAAGVHPPASGSATIDYIQRVVSGTTGEFYNLICDNHRSLDECKRSGKTSIYMEKLEELSQKVREGRVKITSKSLVRILLEILDSSS